MCHEASGVALSQSVGVGKGSVTFHDFEHADAIFVFGQNPGTNHPRMLEPLREAVKRDGLIVVVDSNRAVRQHGMPPAQLRCELGALALRPVKFSMLSAGDVYFAAFRIAGPRPKPDQIRPCKPAKSPNG